MNNIFKLIVKSHLWLACIATLLVLETYLKLSLTIDKLYITTVFCAVIVAYNTHSLIGYKYQRLSFELLIWFKHHRKWVFGMSVMVLIYMFCSVYFLFQSHNSLFLLALPVLFFLHQWTVVMLPPSLPTAVLKFITNVFAWTAVTSIIPLLIIEFDFNDMSRWFIVGRFLLFAILFLLFEYRDRAHDEVIKKQNILHYLSINSFRFLFYALLVCITLVLITFKNQLLYIDVVATVFVLVLFYKFKNITSYYHTMLFWDGLLMVFPIVTLYLNY
jgi:hypothetical protein